ncbi:helix-turn-helix domain-containing protein [uncultured Methylobacterium sp.]|uniref:helix-turn-helix domain-containing protein n=1 Tax=uncultured Methylobacterium sp. TaxID=157278 RepID=UPI0035CA3054
MASLPVTLFDASCLAARTNPSAWQAVFPHLEIVRGQEGIETDLEERVAIWRLSDMVVTQASLSAVEFRRSPARIRADERDAFDFAFVVKGSWEGRAGESEVSVGPGKVVALDLSRPYAFATTATECVVVSVARAALLDAVSTEVSLHGHVFGGAGGALLIDHCLSLARHIGRVQVAEVQAVRAGMLAQMVAAVTLMAPTEDAKPSVLKMRHTVRRYIDQHLADEDLCPDDIVRALGISRSTIYRSFKSSGGIDAFIQGRRLRALHALLMVPGEGRSIGELAQTFGFTRPSHLATAFRRTFGYSPGQLRSSASPRSGGITSSSGVRPTGKAELQP